MLQAKLIAVAFLLFLKKNQKPDTHTQKNEQQINQNKTTKKPTHTKKPQNQKQNPKNPNQNKKLFPPSMKIAKLYTEISILVVAG